MSRGETDSDCNPRLATEEHKKLVELRRRLRILQIENEIIGRARRRTLPTRTFPQNTVPDVQELALSVFASRWPAGY